MKKLIYFDHMTCITVTTLHHSTPQEAALHYFTPNCDLKKHDLLGSKGRLRSEGVLGNGSHTWPHFLATLPGKDSFWSTL